MKLATYQKVGDEVHRVGVIEGETVREVRGDPPGTDGAAMLTLIAGWDPDAVRARLSEEQIPLTEVRLRAPIPVPAQNVICLGRNYAEHAQEMAAVRQEITPPTFFSKAVTTVIGPHDDIPYDAQLSTEIDWEVELACVVGRRARHVAREDAYGYIFGYMVLNDVSARDLQYGHGGQFFFGKSLDGSCPTGPWIVTADEVLSPSTLPLALRVNGYLKQKATTVGMIVDIPAVIEILSRGMTLLPGQIIATGTPSGVGYARTPREFLKPGDVVESEIKGIGLLRNVVRSV